ncbi:MAG TPA: hypothetical protein VNN22_20785 [Verrucomicrobiae bacterium]|nr:hypothetical protein [Verrucomicrobiae bacterium]
MKPILRKRGDGKSADQKTAINPPTENNFSEIVGNVRRRKNKMQKSAQLALSLLQVV